MTISLRIAIADDEPIYLSYVRTLLKEIGHEVVSQSDNGKDLVDACRKHKPDLIVSDVSMPELDGLEAARLINGERRTLVILASARLDLDELGRGIDYVVARLAKPIDSGHLGAAIRLAFHSRDGV